MFTAINEIPTTLYAASKNKLIHVAYQDTSAAGNFGYAFRLDNVEYRNKVDDVIKCMKQDGTMAALYQKWYGMQPEAGSAVITVYPGYGAPGFKGYVETAPQPSCS